jgi:hypothetical protein
MAWKKKFNPKKYKHSQYVLAGLLFVSLVIIGFVFWIIISQLNESKSAETTNSTQTETVEDVVVEESTEAQFDSVVLQKIVDDWVVSTSGVASVSVTNLDDMVIASYSPAEVYFAASIYKIYVAYAGYQQVDRGEVDPDEIYVNGNTRTECLDLMIRDSDSPCAEKLWNEIGKAELTEELRAYGMKNTSMEAITTTAEDAGIMLARVARGEGLSPESQAAYLDSMKDQDAIYRRGLPSGFTVSTVYNKVGWNELVEWHDTAIVKLSDGRKLIITVMSENVGFRKVAELGSSIEKLIIGE